MPFLDKPTKTDKLRFFVLPSDYNQLAIILTKILFNNNQSSTVGS